MPSTRGRASSKEWIEGKVELEISVLVDRAIAGTFNKAPGAGEEADVAIAEIKNPRADPGVLRAIEVFPRIFRAKAFCYLPYSGFMRQDYE